MDQTGKAWADLPAHERSQMISAWGEAKAKGLNIGELITQRPDSSVTSKTIKDVIKELLATKTAAGRVAEYLKVLKIVLNQFSKGIEEQMIDTIQVGHIESFLDSKSLASRSTNRSRISTLFKFAVRRGYCIKNPCEQLESVTYHKPPPQIFTPEQLAAALKWLTENPRGLTWFVLTTLCGLRPEEAQKTTRDRIQCLAGHVIVDKQTTKVRERRVVTPMPEAMKWLRRSLKYGGETPITKQFKKRLILRLRKVIGFKKWPKDITRHTAASIWLARIKSAAEVAEQLGNSEKVLKKDYKALLTQDMLTKLLAVIQK